ncbi:MAG TPA: tRNA pseudouridine(38-40) synthase TruA [Acidimicrobiales bacterium]|nr:tRNA pseudouridine(38-40) synthase TruA [Acidimicrobiales bacterium]
MSPPAEAPTLFDDPEPGLEPAEPTERLRLVVAYDGAPYRGFAANAGVPTVGGTLAEALRTVLGHPVELGVAGRTDAGVHARANVVHVDTRPGVDLVRLQRSLNRLLRPTIAVAEVAVAPPGFDARHSARARTYRYTVLNRPVPDPLRAATSWHVEEPLDLAGMRLGCDPLIGEHDFASFCRRPKRPDGEEASLVRRVRAADWTDAGDGVLWFEITASAFCHQMVRSLVGTLVDVGVGRLHAGDLMAILRAPDRHAAGRLAPPQGLVLWSVAYG